MSESTPEFEVIIIGSGFGGQCAAIRLLKMGITQFQILERRAFMGGTWVQNSYPGAAVDVQSPLYSISYEPHGWSQMFAEQAELEAYTHRVIDKYNLRDKTRTNANVVGLQWDESAQHWQVHWEGGDVLHAQFVINASGPLSMPVIPPFEGRDTFQGESFHTNAWNHEYDLRGKRVAIIGSGASAAQVIPAIVDKVAQLHVFQRTPHWVMPRPDYRFKPWQQKLLGKPFIHKLVRTAVYWGLETRVVGFKYSRTMLKLVAQSAAKRHIERQIKNPQLRAQITPDYTIGCKRVIVSSTLYPALAHANTTVYDKTQGIERITPTGIRTQDGRDIELDLIVYSTGYDATDGLIPYSVLGTQGHTLQHAWRAFPRAYLGTSVPHFPNFFIMVGPNTGIGHTSAIFVIESQINYIAHCIAHVRAHKQRSIEVKPEAEARYTQMIHREMSKTVWHDGGCNSWYKSQDGHVIAMFPGFSFSFRWLTRKMKPQDHVLK